MLRRNPESVKKPRVSFKPDFLAKDIASIDFKYLKKIGVTTCFIDLDGTVVGRSTFEVPAITSQILKDSGLDIKIATNRPRSRSLENLEHQLNASGVIHPKGFYAKPTKHYFQNALKEFGLKPTQVVMIGDRMLQDISGANRSGIYSLMVNKVGPSIGTVDKTISRLEWQATVRLSAQYQKI